MLKMRIGPQLLQLGLPSEFCLVVAVLGVAVGVALGLWVRGLVQLDDLSASLILGSLAGLGLGGCVCCWLEARLATNLPAGLRTVGDLAALAAPSFAEDGKRPASDALKSEIERDIRGMVSCSFGIPEEKVTRDKRFYEDLGLG